MDRVPAQAVAAAAKSGPALEPEPEESADTEAEFEAL
jgi:hypothetical protein